MTAVRVQRIGAPRTAFDAALIEAGVEVVDDPAATLVHWLPPVDALDEVTPCLLAWTRAAREATAAGGDVVTIIDAAGFDTDRTAPAMVAHGIVAATRALAMERARDGGRANLVAVGNAGEGEVARTVRWLLDSPSVTAEVVILGAARHGRQAP